MKNKTDIYDRLIQAGKAHGLANETEIADAIGITGQVLNHWKNRGFPKGRFLDVSFTFGISPVWLVYGVGTMLSTGDLSDTETRILLSYRKAKAEGKVALNELADTILGKYSG
jgi:hypothetical protein